METYNVFIKYYDEIVRWINSPLDEEVEFLAELIKKYNSKKNTEISILETACGTWVVAKEFVKKWFDVTWLDISEKMLEVAKTNLSDEKLVLADMTDFNLNKNFDVVLCNYNSICHLSDWSSWQKFFEMAYNHLNENWVFIFDINTVFEFENITRDFAQFYNFWDDTVCLEMFKKDWIYEWLVKMFQKREDWSYTLTQEVVRENTFPIHMIKKELKNRWFKVNEILDFHYWEVNSESERVYFVWTK